MPLTTMDRLGLITVADLNDFGLPLGIADEIEGSALCGEFSGRFESYSDALRIDSAKIVIDTAAAGGAKVIFPDVTCESEGAIAYNRYACVITIVGYKILEVNIASLATKKLVALINIH